MLLEDFTSASWRGRSEAPSLARGNSYVPGAKPGPRGMRRPGRCANQLRVDEKVTFRPAPGDVGQGHQCEQPRRLEMHVSSTRNIVLGIAFAALCHATASAAPLPFTWNPAAVGLAGSAFT